MRKLRLSIVSHLSRFTWPPSSKISAQTSRLVFQLEPQCLLHHGPDVLWTQTGFKTKRRDLRIFRNMGREKDVKGQTQPASG